MWGKLVVFLNLDGFLKSTRIQPSLIHHEPIASVHKEKELINFCSISHVKVALKNLVVIPFEAILLEVIVVIEVREELKPLKLLSEYVFSAETIKLYFMYRVRQENPYTPVIYHIKSCMNATETCNTVIEREFCGLSDDYFENCEK